VFCRYFRTVHSESVTADGNLFTGMVCPAGTGRKMKLTVTSGQPIGHCFARAKLDAGYDRNNVDSSQLANAVKAKLAIANRPNKLLTQPVATMSFLRNHRCIG
jgi:hypothetical protein